MMLLQKITDFVDENFIFDFVSRTSMFFNFHMMHTLKTCSSFSAEKNVDARKIKFFSIK